VDVTPFLLISLFERGEVKKEKGKGGKDHRCPFSPYIEKEKKRGKKKKNNKLMSIKRYI